MKKSNQYKVRILLLGPKNAGKSRIANYLADMNLEVPDEVRATDSLRILEYDVNDVEVNGSNGNIDVQLWDTSGNEKCTSYWPVFRNNADGIVFVHAPGDEESGKKLDYMHNYFVGQKNFSLRSCLVCTLNNSGGEKLPSVFGKISQVNVNLDTNAEKFRAEFSKFVVSLAND